MNFICFIFCKLLRIRKGVNHPIAYSLVRHRQVALYTNKHGFSSRPAGMNFPVNLFSCMKFGGFNEREQEQKAQVSKKCDGRGDAQFLFGLINKNCLLSPLGRAAPGAALCPRVVLLLCHSCYSCLLLFGWFCQFQHGKDSELFWNEQEKGGEIFGEMRKLS